MQLKQQTENRVESRVAYSEKQVHPQHRKGAALRFNKREVQLRLHSYSTGGVQSFMRLGSRKILYTAFFRANFFIGGEKFAGKHNTKYRQFNWCKGLF